MSKESQREPTPLVHLGGRTLSKAELIPVFLCYRQSDGMEVAGWLYDELDHKPVDDEFGSPIVDVYFDKAAPAVSDWTTVHLPSLQRARALILVCTPEAFDEKKGRDWVHMELDWWLAHRTSAPIVIEAAGEDGVWVPRAVKERWPNSQRVLLQLDTWLPKEASFREKVALKQIRGGIRASEKAVLFEDIENLKRLNRRLQNSLTLTRVLGVFLFSTSVSLYFYRNDWKALKEEQVINNIGQPTPAGKVANGFRTFVEDSSLKNAHVERVEPGP